MKSNTVRPFRSQSPQAQPQQVPPSQAPQARAQENLADPHRLARVFLDHQRVGDGGDDYRLKYWRDEWWRWDGRRYQPVSAVDLSAAVNIAIKDEFDRYALLTGDRAQSVYRATVSNTRLALASMVLVPSETEQPVWLGPDQDTVNYIALANGLLDLDELLREGRGTPSPRSSSPLRERGRPRTLAPGYRCGPAVPG